MNELPSHLQDLGVVTLEANKTLQATPPKLRSDVCVDVRQRGKPKKEARTKKQRTCYVRVATAAQQRCSSSYTAVPPAAFASSSSAARGSTASGSPASGSICLSNRSKQHQQQQRQQQLPFLLFSILGPTIPIGLLLVSELLLLRSAYARHGAGALSS